jgi:glutaredoxin-like YruB-family protein
MVKIYSTPECPWCHKVKNYLKSKNVEYQDFNVEEDDAARDELYKLTNDLIVPVTTIDGSTYVTSFDKAKLDEMIGLS